MAASTALLTAEEFLAMSFPEGKKYELSEGVIVEVERTTRAIHAVVKGRFHKLLTRYTLQNPIGEVLEEASVVLKANNVRIPDLCLITNEKLAATDLSRCFVGAPELAIEVVSSEPADELQLKIEEYLESGSRVVLVAYPKTKAVQVSTRDRASRLLKNEDVLDAPSVLPGFSARVADIFAGL